MTDLTDFLQRLKDELGETTERWIKLRDFINSDRFKGVHNMQKYLMIKQLEIMGDYRDILRARIAQFEE